MRGTGGGGHVVKLVDDELVLEALTFEADVVQLLLEFADVAILLFKDFV